jgi:hypothetical protein
VPAWRATRIDLNETLRESGRSLTGGIAHNRLRSVLVVAQTAGSLVVLIMAGLFLRSLRHAQTADLGFQPAHVLNLTMACTNSVTTSSAARIFIASSPAACALCRE